MSTYRIGRVSKKLGMSIDTLRYYEKIGLLPRVGRDGSGLRVYEERDISRLKFIQRAQLMNFSLAEIGALLKLRENPAGARADIRQMTERKLTEIAARLDSLQTLRGELALLVNLCHEDGECCPIITGIEHGGERKLQ